MLYHRSLLFICTFAWTVPWTEEPGGLQSMGSLESDTTEWLHFPFSLSCIGRGNGSPLQFSCLENPRDGGTWGAAVYGVAESVGHDWNDLAAAAAAAAAVWIMVFFWVYAQDWNCWIICGSSILSFLRNNYFKIVLRSCWLCLLSQFFSNSVITLKHSSCYI